MTKSIIKILVAVNSRYKIRRKISDLIQFENKCNIYCISVLQKIDIPIFFDASNAVDKIQLRPRVMNGMFLFLVFSNKTVVY